MLPASELLDGELISLPPAKRSHMEMAKRFVRLLETAVDAARVWIEMGYQLGDRWLQADHARHRNCFTRQPRRPTR